MGTEIKVTPWFLNKYKKFINSFQCSFLLDPISIMRNFFPRVAVMEKFLIPNSSTKDPTAWYNLLKNEDYLKSSKETRGVILSLRVKMGFLLEFGYFCLLFFKFTVGLFRIRVLFEGGSLLWIYSSQKASKIWNLRNKYSLGRKVKVQELEKLKGNFLELYLLREELFSTASAWQSD